ncbi:MAG: efflux RND transporter periplasmic adaptor subunit [Azonexus sp.]|jgi:RND family efflux transporter MFP subunit|nr:efflux RND transporter periplasmic adaptor subunit [Azonexus sp.]
MKKSIPLFLATLLLAHGSFADAALFVDLSEAQRQGLGVETQAVTAATIGNERFPARVVVPPAQMRIVAAPVAGRLEMLAVVPGDTVTQGQVLARLSSPQALQLERDVQQARAQATLWRQNLRRDEQLFSEGLIAESRLQATRAAAEQAFAQEAERQRGLQLVGGSGGKAGEALPLTSPITGVILEKGAQLGQRVEESAIIYRVASLSPLWVEIQAPLTIASALRRDMQLLVVAPSLRGKLVSIGRLVDPLSQTVLVRGQIDAGAESLTPGQMLEVELDGHLSHGIQMPVAAVIRHGGKALVFVQSTTPGRYEAREIRIIGQGGGAIEVEGLPPGAQVVVKGASSLKALLGEDGKDGGTP